MLPYMLSVVMVFPFIHSRPIRLELKLFYQTYTARKPPSACTVVTLSPPDAPQWYSLLLRAAYGAVAHALLCNVLSMGMTQQFFVLGDLDLWPLTPNSNSGETFVHITAKFHHPMFNRSEVIVRTNWHSDKQTNRRRWRQWHRYSLRYITPMGNDG